MKRTNVPNPEVSKGELAQKQTTIGVAPQVVLAPGSYKSNNPVWRGITLKVTRSSRKSPCRYHLYDNIKEKLVIKNLRNPPNDFNPIIP